MQCPSTGFPSVQEGREASDEQKLFSIACCHAMIRKSFNVLRMYSSKISLIAFRVQVVAEIKFVLTFLVGANCMLVLDNEIPRKIKEIYGRL